MKHRMCAAIATFAAAMLMTALFTAAFAASIRAISPPEASPRSYERNRALDGSDFPSASFGPEAQSRMREKFSVYGKSETVLEDGSERTVLALFTDEQAELLYSRRESGERSGLRYDEILFLINDTVQSVFSYDLVVAPGAECCGFSGRDGVLAFSWDFDRGALVSDTELINRYDENLKGLAELIVCRLSAFDAGFTLPGELDGTEKRWMLVDNGFETELASYRFELSGEYEKYAGSDKLKAPLIVYDPLAKDAYIRMIETDGTETALFPTAELLEARPVRRPVSKSAPSTEPEEILALSSYPLWFGAFESGGYAVLEALDETGDLLRFYSADGSFLAGAETDPNSRFGIALYGDVVYCIENAGMPGAVVRRFSSDAQELERVPILHEIAASSVMERVRFVFDGASARAIVNETRRNSQGISVTNRYFLDLATGETESLGWFGQKAGYFAEPAALYGDSILASVGGGSSKTLIVHRDKETTELPGLVIDKLPTVSSGKHAAILYANGFAAVIEIETGEVCCVRLAATGEGGLLALSGDGQTLCTCDTFEEGGVKQVVRLYDTVTGLLITEFSVPNAFDPHFTGFPYIDLRDEARLLIPVKTETGLYAAAVKIPESILG